ncbi:hypothetical protein [Ferruginibacter sp.]
MYLNGKLNTGVSGRKKILLSISLTFLTYFFICYHSENKKYEIINEIFNDLDMHPSRIWHSAKVIDYDNKILNHFSFFDKLSIYTQIGVQHTNAFLNSGDEIIPGKITYKDRKGKIHSPEIVSVQSKETKEVIGNRTIIHAAKCHYIISMPLISSDNKTAIMQIDEYCEGGSGSIYILEKIDGKWKVVEEILQWIS